MATNFKFTITPDQILFPEFPKFDLFFKKKVSGWICTEAIYTWSCLPGYMKENEGTISFSDYTDVGGKGFGFFLYLRPYDSDDAATNPCYGTLWDIPKNFSIGSTGSAGIHYRGFRVKELMTPGIASTLYADWKLVNVY